MVSRVENKKTKRLLLRFGYQKDRIGPAVLVTNIVALLFGVVLFTYMVMDISQWTFWQKILVFVSCVGVVVPTLYFTKCEIECYHRQIQNELLETKRFAQEMQLQKRQEQLNALQSQINPHFLYNALDTIRGMAIEENCMNVAEIIATLSHMFKYSMDYSSSLVTLNNEITHLEHYLKIQDMRFPGRFRFEQVYECDFKDLQAVTIPKLTLQPIVENAINHGFKNQMANAVICLRYIRAQTNFEIVVSDNGIGIEDEMVLSLNREFLKASGMTEGMWPDRDGIALSNIDSRMKIYCGETYGLHIVSTLGKGTDVTLTLPATDIET